MSEENLWGDEEPFNDVPDEVNGQPTPAPSVRLQRPQTPTPPQAPAPVVPNPTYEEIVEEAQTEDYEDAMADAHLRLEQGSLYKMIMNHELFEGMDADPKAIQNVQNEMRQFARERMEIMLGMRQETAKAEFSGEFPFNALEVQVLKMVASTATKGASENAESYVPEGRAIAKKILRPIGGSTTAKKVPQKAPAKPLSSKPTNPVARSKMDLTIDQIAKEEGIPRELLEENLPGVGGKPVHEMTETEIIERNRLATQRRGKQAKSPNAIPMATEQQQEMLAQSQVGSLGQSPLMRNLIDAVKKMPIKNS